MSNPSWPPQRDTPGRAQPNALPPSSLQRVSGDGGAVITLITQKLRTQRLRLVREAHLAPELTIPRTSTWATWEAEKEKGSNMKG